MLDGSQRSSKLMFTHERHAENEPFIKAFCWVPALSVINAACRSRSEQTCWIPWGLLERKSTVDGEHASEHAGMARMKKKKKKKRNTLVLLFYSICTQTPQHLSVLQSLLYGSLLSGSLTDISLTELKSITDFKIQNSECGLNPFLNWRTLNKKNILNTECTEYWSVQNAVESAVNRGSIDSSSFSAPCLYNIPMMFSKRKITDISLCTTHVREWNSTPSDQTEYRIQQV